MRHGAALLHADPDFDAIAQCAPRAIDPQPGSVAAWTPRLHDGGDTNHQHGPVGGTVLVRTRSRMLICLA
jgi:cytochrome c5